MTIAYVNEGAVTNSTANPQNVAYPASPVLNNLLVLFINNKYPGNEPNTPSGWTRFGSYNGGAGSAGIDSGNAVVTIFTKPSNGTESGNLSVSFAGTLNVASCVMYQYSKTNTNWDLAACGGSDNSAGTAWSVTGDVDPGVTAGDLCLAFSGANGNTYTYASELITQTGVTFGTMTERMDNGTTSGDDQRRIMAEIPVTSGTGSAAPVYTMTASGTAANEPAGATIILRLRETAGGVTVTPGVVNLTTSLFAPVLNFGIIPGLLSLALSTFAPTIAISDNKIVTPDIITLTTATFAPTIAISDNKTIIPDTIALSMATFAPTIAITDNKIVIPDFISLTTATFAPVLNLGIIPDIIAITTATFAPTIIINNNQIVTPDTVPLIITLYAPNVVITNNQLIIPGVIALIISNFNPIIDIKQISEEIPTKGGSVHRRKKVPISTTLKLQLLREDEELLQFIQSFLIQ